MLRSRVETRVKIMEEKKPLTHQAESKKKIVLTPKQARFLSAKLQGKSRPEALKEAGLSAHTSTSRLEGNPNLRAVLLGSMDKHGLTEDFIVSKMKSGLNAKKVLYATKDGVISDVKKVPDNETQHKYFRDVLEIRGDIKQSNIENLNIGLISIPEVKAEESWNSEITQADTSDTSNQAE